MKPLLVFSHGKDAPPWGRKISYLAPLAEKTGWRVTSIDYTDLESPEKRVKRLCETDLGPYSCLVLAGSSMGGYVSAIASGKLRPDGLFLMAPAFYLPGYANQSPHTNQSPGAHARRICICSGWNDAVVPVDASIRFARETRAELHLFDSDHALWDALEPIGEILTAFLRKTLEP